MNGSQSLSPETARFELRFRSLLDESRSLVFPCDATGHVDMDALSDKARAKYLYARTVVGCEYSRPIVSLRDTD